MRDDREMDIGTGAWLARVAASHGLSGVDPVVLEETNNTVVWLRPYPIVAKVGTWSYSAEVLSREHELATFLSEEGAEVGSPAAGFLPTVDPDSGFVVTMWDRLEHDPTQGVEPHVAAASLRRLHEDLRRYPGELPSYEVAVGRAQAVVEGAQPMGTLPAADRALLAHALGELVGTIASHGFESRPLHGEPHGGNLLATPAGPRWIDLEDAAMGPVEWDLAFLPGGAAPAYGSADRDLLRLTRTLVSACVATWCWLRSDLAGMRAHAIHHLERVRADLGSV
jgi:hypothetical protein